MMLEQCVDGERSRDVVGAELAPARGETFCELALREVEKLHRGIVAREVELRGR